MSEGMITNFLKALTISIAFSEILISRAELKNKNQMQLQVTINGVPIIIEFLAMRKDPNDTEIRINGSMMK